MSVGGSFRYPDDKWAQRERMRRLCWLSVVLLLVAGTLIFLTVGQSQAMKTAWVSDVLTAVPPAALLLAMRHELRESTKRYPYGYFRSVSIAFLVTASVLLVVGLYLLYDSLMKLVKQERPPIGTIVLFGHQLWLGWAMIGALAFSMSVGILLGRLKQPVAEALHSKALEAEARMNRAEWMSEGAAIIGLLLVAFGLWWGDAAAAAFISVEIVRDGWHNMRQVIADLMDESPSVLGEHEMETVPAKLKVAAERLDWVERAAVRLREQGHVLSGELYVVPTMSARGNGDLAERAARAADELRSVDWRLHGLTVMPVPRLESDAPPRW
jgi:cation diffusion facilitator family transporter